MGMMFGDKKKFNVALLTLKCVGATGDLAGTDKLDGAAKQWGKTIEDATSSPAFIAAVTKAIEETGQDGSVTPSRAAKIQKFTVVGPDFSIEGGELTPTQKLKRSVVAEKYQSLLDAMYEHDDVFVPFSAGGKEMDEALFEQGENVPTGSFKVDTAMDDV